LFTVVCEKYHFKTSHSVCKWHTALLTLPPAARPPVTATPSLLFSADRTNGHAYDTVLRPSVVMYCG